MIAKAFRVLAAVVVASLISVLLVTAPQRADALSGSQFDPGYIISDSNFYTRDAMSQDQIQAFLNAQIGTCRNSLCLNVLRVDTPTTTLSFGTCATYPGEANESAARIIFKVQQACAISAKVLLVTLQKEQGLVTDSAPLASELRNALGQGCPDTAPCDSTYYGFFNQVYSAARQFAWYGNPQGSHTSIRVGNYNNVLFSPNACGSSSVLIKNGATAALYYYTPYQPNAAALANLGGTGDACSSYGNRNFWVYYTNWFGSPTGTGNPFGVVEGRAGGIGGVRIGGWAIDPDTSESIEVHVYVDGVGTRTVANATRTDVGRAYPGAGDAHGFNATIPVSSSGNHTVCVYAINAGRGSNVLLDCMNIVAQGGSPAGVLEGVSTSDGAVQVSGWAIDPDTASSIPVHVYVDSVGTAVVASGSRPDVGVSNPGYGDLHGFAANLPAGPGKHSICAYAINTGGGVNALLGCSTVTVFGEQGRAPFGVLEGVRGVTGGIEMSGWAIDPDTASSIAVHLYVDGASAAYRADKSRTDVGAAYPGYGDNHGYAETVVATPGSHQVCAYGINAGPGVHTLLGCSTVTVPGASGIVEKGRAPFGVLEGARGVTGGIEMSGWAIDPDTAAPVAVHLYVDSAGAAYLADKSRVDVGGAYPGYGDNHGFAELVPASPGAHRVCAYGINSGPGVNTLLGCSTVSVP
ncbi:hypothetical protein E3O19_03410 [Cryobacterium algoritolerans]|uniref:Hemagglutinin n=1 Tax=Cryobacterium algoritolerans TaxID=1259184 RepID=A0A4R8WW37_9MICO|nr:hypothetical protein [Cryobacterium algoritolerans]TFC19196.1 hypothetical protein E3O19_03410 [Cryobacterium algoritolerans]